MINLQEICKKLEAIKCRLHHQYPKATVKGKSIQLTTCCEAFQNLLDKKIDDEISKQMDNSIDDALNF